MASFGNSAGGANTNTACGSMKRLISHAEAMRSTWGRGRVTQRRLASVSLDVLREPLEVLVAVRRVGEQVGGALEGDGPERAEPSPHPNAQARRRRRQPDQQQE